LFDYIYICAYLYIIKEQQNKTVMTVFQQLEDLSGKLSYVLSALAAGNLEAWEAKEYSNLASDYESEITELKNHIETYFP